MFWPRGFFSKPHHGIRVRDMSTVVECYGEHRNDRWKKIVIANDSASCYFLIKFLDYLYQRGLPLYYLLVDYGGESRVNFWPTRSHTHVCETIIVDKKNTSKKKLS